MTTLETHNKPASEIVEDDAKLETGHITNGGARPNIIHAYAAGQFVVRSSSKARLEGLKKRVIACFVEFVIGTD